jgi:hypothetical protein
VVLHGGALEVLIDGNGVVCDPSPPAGISRHTDGQRGDFRALSSCCSF